MLAALLSFLRGIYCAIAKFFGIELELDKDSDKSFKILAEKYGFNHKNHFVVTEDGYELCLQRLTRKDMAADVGESGSGKVTVLLLHGLLQDGGSFLCSGHSSLASVLMARGYDVWLGNNRGNKYSSRHKHLNQSSEEYWDFCLDDLAKYDVPALVNHILHITQKSKICLIGFSQGSAQSFMALASDPNLCEKISLFLALSPAVKPIGLDNRTLQNMGETNPFILNTWFGKKSMFPNVVFYQAVLSKQAFSAACIIMMYFFFGWKSKNLAVEARPQLFEHGFSFSSVKIVVHWFQIINNPSRRLARFQPRGSHNGKPSASEKYYDLSAITCPVASIGGGADNLVDASVTADLVSACVYCHVEPTYEHLDLIWADNAPEVIHPKVLQLLEKFCSP